MSTIAPFSPPPASPRSKMTEAQFVSRVNAPVSGARLGWTAGRLLVLCCVALSASGCFAPRSARFDADQLRPYQATGTGVVKGGRLATLLDRGGRAGYTMPPPGQGPDDIGKAFVILVPVIDFTREDYEREVLRQEALAPFGDEVRTPIRKCCIANFALNDGSFSVPGVPPLSYYVFEVVYGPFVPSWGLPAPGMYFGKVDVRNGTVTEVKLEGPTQTPGYSFADLACFWAPQLSRSPER